MSSTRKLQLGSAVLLAALGAVLSGCRQDMHDQPKYKPHRESTFFEDGMSSRAPVEGTVARGQLRDDAHFYTGKAGVAGGGAATFAETFPFTITAEVLDRGQERYNISCSPCHGRLGDGEGMVVKRGFRQPPSFHIERLRKAPPGYFFDVMTNGIGAMPDYAVQLGPRDRWAVAAYIRVLQQSQNAVLADVPESERKRLEESR